MIVDGFDFTECDMAEDAHLLPEGKEECLRIVRHAAHAMCDGQIPGDLHLRHGLLLSTIAKLAIECSKAVAAAKKEVPASERGTIDAKANYALASLIAAAAAWAVAAEQGANVVANYGD